MSRKSPRVPPAVAYVIVDCDTATTRSEGDSHLTRSTSTHDVSGIQLVGNGEYYHVAVGSTPEVGKEYFLLLAVFSESDSFGVDRDGRIEYIDLYQSLDLAEENRRRILDYHKATQNNWLDQTEMELNRRGLRRPATDEQQSLILKQENGTEFKHAPRWEYHGYSLTYLEIAPVRITPVRRIYV